MNRYFIVSVNATSPQGGWCGGDVTVTTSDGSYLNSTILRRDLLESKKLYGCKAVTILNILELSEEDYKEWSRIPND